MHQHSAAARSVALFSCLIWPALAFSQTPALPSGIVAQAERPGLLEEVVVTARGREEDLQEVPLSITVLGNEAIEERGIVDARDLVQFSPNVVFYSGSGRADLTALVVRGLSPNTSDERYQGLSVFIDGVYISGQLAGIDLSQLERVEIIKGPQSAKYGRATYSGAMDYITPTPRSETLEGNLRAKLSSHGSDSDPSGSISAAIEFPMVQDRLWLSLNGLVSRVGGRFDNPGSDGGVIGEERTVSGGATLFARFSDSASLKLRVAYDSEQDSAPIATVLQPTDWGGVGYDIDGLYTLTSVSPVTPGCPMACQSLGTVWIDGDIPNTGLGLTGTDVIESFPDGYLPSDYPEGGGRDRERLFASALFTKTFAGGHEASYRFGFYEQEYWSVEDFRRRARVGDPTFGALGLTGAAKTGFNIAFEERFRNQSHQLRLASPATERLRWGVGLYYFEEENRNRGVSAFNPMAPAPAVVRESRGLERFENVAVFGELAFDFTERLTATLEARQQFEDVFYDACTTCSTVNPVDRKNTDEAFLPRVTLQYAFTDAVNAYGYYSKGEKSGRFNTSAGAFNFAFVPPEELDNFEVGFKSRLWDGRAILNIAAFYQDVKDQQLLANGRNPLCTFDPITSAATCPPGVTIAFPSGVVTAGDSEIYGAELEGRVQLTDRFGLQGSYGYAHHEFTDPIGPFPSIDPQFFLPGETLEGKTSLNTPRSTASLSADYAMPLNNRLSLRLRGDAIYSGSRFIDLANRASIEAVTRFNARVSLGSERGWQLSLFGKDLTDERAPLGAGITGSSSCYYPEPVGAPVAGQRCAFLGIPRGRELGIELDLRF